MAAGGHGADGRELPGRRGGRQRLRRPGRRAGRGGGRGRRRPSCRRPTACSAARCAAGTADLSVEPGDDARGGGRRRSRSASPSRSELVEAGARCLLTGDMGIANTTASAALIAALHRRGPGRVTGRGTGIDDATLARKTDVVRAGARAARARPGRPGRGARRRRRAGARGARRASCSAAAALRVPVVLDGVIAGAAALVAAGPRARPSSTRCIAGHRSAEPGHAVALAAPGAAPAGGPRAAPGRGHRRRAGAAAGAGGGPRAARDGHLRQRRRHRQGRQQVTFGRAPMGSPGRCGSSGASTACSAGQSTSSGGPAPPRRERRSASARSAVARGPRGVLLDMSPADAFAPEAADAVNRLSATATGPWPRPPDAVLRAGRCGPARARGAPSHRDREHALAHVDDPRRRRHRLLSSTSGRTSTRPAPPAAWCGTARRARLRLGRPRARGERAVTNAVRYGTPPLRLSSTRRDASRSSSWTPAAGAARQRAAGRRRRGRARPAARRAAGPRAAACAPEPPGKAVWARCPAVRPGLTRAQPARRPADRRLPRPARPGRRCAPRSTRPGPSAPRRWPRPSGRGLARACPRSTSPTSRSSPSTRRAAPTSTRRSPSSATRRRLPAALRHRRRRRLRRARAARSTPSCRRRGVTLYLPGPPRPAAPAGAAARAQPACSRRRSARAALDPRPRRRRRARSATDVRRALVRSRPQLDLRRPPGRARRRHGRRAAAAAARGRPAARAAGARPRRGRPADARAGGRADGADGRPRADPARAAAGGGVERPAQPAHRHRRRRLMLDGGVGLLRTLPPARRAGRRVAAPQRAGPRASPGPRARLRRRSCGPRPGRAGARGAADLATRLLRGAGYTAFDGDAARAAAHSAVAAPYAHCTAPLRRYADRWVGRRLPGARARGRRCPTPCARGLPAAARGDDGGRAAGVRRSSGPSSTSPRRCCWRRGWARSSRARWSRRPPRAGPCSCATRRCAPACEGADLPLGQPVRVRLDEADPDARRVRFTLLEG